MIKYNYRLANHNLWFPQLAKFHGEWSGKVFLWFIYSFSLKLLEQLISLMKTTLFYFYFMPILMLSHLFCSYFILANLYFIPSLPDEENRASILFVFYIYFKPIFKQDRSKWGILFVFSHKILQNRLFYPYFSLGGKGDDLICSFAK